jgi:hypothetical protein
MTSPASLMPFATVPPAPVAEGSSIVVKMLTGMLSPPHRRRALVVRSPLATAEVATMRACARLAKDAASVKKLMAQGGTIVLGYQQAFWSVVSNGCCASEPKSRSFKSSAASPPPAKPAIACTS